MINGWCHYVCIKCIMISVIVIIVALHCYYVYIYVVFDDYPTTVDLPNKPKPPAAEGDASGDACTPSAKKKTCILPMDPKFLKNYTCTFRWGHLNKCLITERLLFRCSGKIQTNQPLSESILVNTCHAYWYYTCNSRFGFAWKWCSPLNLLGLSSLSPFKQP